MEYFLSLIHIWQQMTTVILVLSFLILMITVALCLYITKGITEPVSEVREAAKNLAEGNLKVQLKYQSEDEPVSYTHLWLRVTDTGDLRPSGNLRI